MVANTFHVEVASILPRIDLQCVADGSHNPAENMSAATWRVVGKHPDALHFYQHYRDLNKV